MLHGDRANRRITVLRQQQDVAGGERGKQDRGRRGHPRGEYERAPALELAERSLVARPGPVPVAAVLVSAGRVAAEVVERRELRSRQERLAVGGIRQPRVNAARAVAASHGQTSSSARAKSSGSNGRRSSSASPI